MSQTEQTAPVELKQRVTVRAHPPPSKRRPPQPEDVGAEVVRIEHAKPFSWFHATDDYGATWSFLFNGQQVGPRETRGNWHREVLEIPEKFRPSQAEIDFFGSVEDVP